MPTHYVIETGSAGHYIIWLFNFSLIMSTSPRRNDLLQARAKSVGDALRAMESAGPDSVAALQLAAWRLRELLPVLRLEAGSAAKVSQRLRKMARRLTKVHLVDAHLRILESLTDIDRTSRQAATRVKNDLRRRKTKASFATVHKKVAADVRRVEKVLTSIAERLQAEGDTSATIREMRWAVKARAARRSTAMKTAMERAGSIYVPGRLHAVRRVVRKLRFGVELLGELAGGVSAADLQGVERAQAGLDEIDDAEALIKRVRRMQAELPPSEARSWQELDALVVAIENRCRRLHGRYMRERGQVLALGSRLGTRGTASGPARRKVS